jgi:hypothetical protein
MRDYDKMIASLREHNNPKMSCVDCDYFKVTFTENKTCIQRMIDDAADAIEELLDRLAAYEDTGLSPEDINDICYRFSCFLSEMTRNRMSKINYTLEAMIQAAQDAHELDCEDYCYLKQMEAE